MATKKETPGKPVSGKPTGRKASNRGGGALTRSDDMERMFDRFVEGFGPHWMHPFRWEWPSWGELGAPLEGRVPRVDVIDRDVEVLIRAELPGVSKDDLDVSVTESSVTITGSTLQEETEEKGSYQRSEIVRGRFSRTLPLAAAVDGAKAKAQFKDGILELTLPKVAASRRRKIKVE